MATPLAGPSPFGAYVGRENDVDDLDMAFSTEDEAFGETLEVDLKTDGRNITVTNENKHEYVECVPADCSTDPPHTMADVR